MILRKGYCLPAADIISYLHWGTEPLHNINCHSVRYRHSVCSVHAISRRMNEFERRALYFSLEYREARWGAPKGGGGARKNAHRGHFKHPNLFFLEFQALCIQLKRRELHTVSPYRPTCVQGKREQVSLHTLLKIVVLSFLRKIFDMCNKKVHWSACNSASVWKVRFSELPV